MAGSKSDSFEGVLLDHIFGISAWTPEANFFLAAFTVAPTDSSAGTEVSTAIWTNYARVSLTRNGTIWTRSGSGVSNASAISLGTAAITGTAPVVVAFALMSASTAGSIRYWGDLLASKTINNGDPVQFNAGELDVTED